MTDLEEITIQHMLENIFKNQQIKKRKRDIVAFYCSAFNVGLFGEASNESGETITQEMIDGRVVALLKDDQREPNPYLKYNRGYYSKARRAAKPIDPAVGVGTAYTGKAGECAVMSELLFRGYNVNNMMVDEGIDLVASKNNVFFYIQVKTATIQQPNRFYFSIKQDRFDSFIGTQMRYILVARCNVNGENTNVYFQFGNNDIEKFLFNHSINRNSNDSGKINFKIDFDPRTGKAFLYDKQRDDITFHMNNFNL